MSEQAQVKTHLDNKILDCLSEGLQVISYDWRYLYLNDAICRQGKYTREELLGNSMLDMYPGIEQTEMFQTLEQCMNVRVSQKIENLFTFPDGSQAWFELRIEPVPEGLIILSVDITEQKKAQEDLLELNKDLEANVARRTAHLLRQKKLAERLKAEAENQKKLVESKQQEIQDSIVYAKRIQNAILPSLDFFNSVVNDCFVFYKPKDIVAGDFYWVARINSELTYIASADCTGHGVPGAMVSVVCNNALNRAVRESTNKDPGHILDLTSELVINQFKQSKKIGHVNRDHIISDGMDISLCCINKKKNVLTWAGANNPLWIIRNGKLIEIKGDRQPIGSYAYQNSFKSHEIEMYNDDVYYIFSDGFADQFGGPKGKKFKTIELRKLLLRIHQHPFDKQKEMIRDEFEQWKGDYEQVDDICLIGFVP